MGMTKNKNTHELIIRDADGEELELLGSGTEAELIEYRTEMLDQEDELGYPAEWLVVQPAA